MKDFPKKLSTKSNSLVQKSLNSKNNDFSPQKNHKIYSQVKISLFEKGSKCLLKGKKEHLKISLKKKNQSDNNSVFKTIEVESEISSFEEDFKKSFNFSESLRKSEIFEGNELEGITRALNGFQTQKNGLLSQEDFIYLPTNILTSRIRKTKINKQSSFSSSSSCRSKVTIDSEGLSFNNLRNSIEKETKVDQTPLLLPQASILLQFI